MKNFTITLFRTPQPNRYSLCSNHNKFQLNSNSEYCFRIKTSHRILKPFSYTIRKSRRIKLNSGHCQKRIMPSTNMSRCTVSVVRARKPVYNVEALIIRAGSWGPLYDNHNKEPQNSIGQKLGPYSNSIYPEVKGVKGIGFWFRFRNPRLPLDPEPGGSSNPTLELGPVLHIYRCSSPERTACEQLQLPQIPRKPVTKLARQWFKALERLYYG